LPASAVFATNTSTIPIARIADAARRPEQVIGMHFFSPVARMPLLEVIPSSRTAPQAVSTTVTFGRRMGKTAIVVKDTPGFWVNRILGPYMNEAAHLLLAGVGPADIDRAMVQFGFPVGPITLLDEVGLDVAQHAGEVLQAAFGDRADGKGSSPTPGQEGRCGSGRLPLLGVHRTAVPSAEIVQPSSAMLSEAARAVGGVVRTARRRHGAIFGFGFPPFRGPLRCLDDLGADRVYADLARLAERPPFPPCGDRRAARARAVPPDVTPACSQLSERTAVSVRPPQPPRQPARVFVGDRRHGHDGAARSQRRPYFRQSRSAGRIGH
jgi:3-hydroxyacyl-CoA dehydrogenase/enoyl-CoA hydratase/3-hydroxybutyryl-CoA epimerase